MASQGIRRNYLVRNQTPYRVVLREGDHSLTLAPLQNRRIGVDPMESLRTVALAAHEDRVIDWEREPLRATRLLWATWLAVVGISAGTVGFGAYLLGSSVAALAVGIGIAVLCAIGGAYIIGEGRRSRQVPSEGNPRPGFATRHRIALMGWAGLLGVSAIVPATFGVRLNWPGWLVWVSVAVALLCLIWLAYHWGYHRMTVDQATPERRPAFSPTPVRGDAWDLTRDFLIATIYGLVVVIVVVVAISAPAAAIYYGTEVSEIIVFKPWNHPSLVAGPDNQYIVVCRVLQLILLILVSLVPALMFFQFDREKLSTLVDRWLHAIFRFDPSLETVADVDAKYGRRVEEFYGATLGLGVVPTRKRLRDRSPVVITTLLIAIGWILVLVGNSAKLPASSAPSRSFQDLFRPPHTPLTMAFLGAYFLSIQVALRGYIRGDLKPKTYNVITVRILMAMVLAWAMQALWGTTDYTLGLAFLAGIIPNTVLRWVRESIEHVKNSAQLRIRDKWPGWGPPGGDGGGAVVDELSEKSPLSELDDVDIYDRTRLEEEGITSVQALARHDLVDLMLSSRIPVPRLIDWLDQAVLHQHVQGTALSNLRKYGIRSATDFLRVYKDARARLELNGVLGPEDVKAELLRVVLEEDEWVRYLKHWRRYDGTEPVWVMIYDSRTQGLRQPMCRARSRNEPVDGLAQSRQRPQNRSASEPRSLLLQPSAPRTDT